MAIETFARRVASIFPAISALRSITQASPTLVPRQGASPPLPRRLSLSNTAGMSSFEEEKRRFLGMSLAQRRNQYPSGHVPLSTVLPWPEYFTANKVAVSRVALSAEKVRQVQGRGVYKVDEELNKRVSVFVGDITKLEVDAIVNAANNNLWGGGGVDGAIHRAGGRFLSDECSTLGGCETSDAKITGGYRLPARYVIHTVGPIGERPSLLESCYRRSLQIAVENNLRTVAFPCISTGVYGYPGEAAVQVVLPVVRTFLEGHRQELDRVIFCLFMATDVDLYNRYMPLFFPLPRV